MVTPGDVQVVAPGKPPVEVELLEPGEISARLILAAAGGPVEIRVQDLHDQPVATIPIGAGGGRVITPSLTLPRGRLSVVSGTARVKVLGVVREQLPIAVESVYADLQLRSVTEESEVVRNTARGIGMVEYSQSGVVNRCNGFLVSKRLFATNEHCISSDSVFAEIYSPRLYFDGGSIEVPVVERIGGIASEVDLALLVIEPQPALANRVVSMASDESLVSSGALRLVQYYAPESWALRSSYDTNCRILEVPVRGRGAATDLAHGCDCERGTSGAPILRTTDAAVIALHHWGSNTPEWNYNKAVRMTMIATEMRRVRTRRPDLFEGVTLP